MTETSKKIVTRFAPSPTGKFHVGGIRTVLYNYLFARKHGGKFILRCEDTDPVRSKKEYEDYFLEVFRWLHLEYDEYYRQSERGEVYRRYLEELIRKNLAYISKEEPKKEGGRTEVIRFRNPNTVVTFRDLVLGEISVDTTDLGDFVIARDIGSPVYHFTVVVDDHEMGVTHIIRGQEHVSNTPRQILIQEAIGASRPIYAHGSIILNEERAKLSKRDPLVRPTLEYRDEGYLPEAMLNFMALLGWNPGTEQEIFTLPELMGAFSIERMQKQGAIFNPEKLEWLNKEHMRSLPVEARMGYMKQYMSEEITRLPNYSDARLRAIEPIILDHITHFGEITNMIKNDELSYFFSRPTYPREKLRWKNENDDDALLRRLTHVEELIATLPEDVSADVAKEAIWDYAEKEGRGQVLWPLRFALSGKERSPDPFSLIAILGRDETLSRIKDAITLFHS